MKTKTFFLHTLACILLFSVSVQAEWFQEEINVQLIVESGFSDTQCGDLFDEPDPGWVITVEDISSVRYAGKINSLCSTFPSLPNLQYEMSYDYADDVPESWKVCFTADEHDPWLGCPNAQCIETICQNLPIPPPGTSVTYTLLIPEGNASWGQVTLTITTSTSAIDPPPGDWGTSCNFTKIYGEEEVDINFGNKIVKTPEGHFVVIGQWNEQAYAMKVDEEGNVLLFKTFETEIGGTSELEDVEPTEDGGYVFTGECENCFPSDTLTKVFVFKTNADFEVDTAIGVKKFGYASGGPFLSTAERTNPQLCKGIDGGYVLASTSIIGQLNYGDIVLTKLDESLDSLWSSFYNFGGIEAVTDLTATDQGYALATVIFFVDEAPVVMTDANGQLLWSQMMSSNVLRGITYSSSDHELFVCGIQTVNPGENRGTLYRLEASDGQLTDSLIIGQGMQENGAFDLNLLSEDHVLLALQKGQAGNSSTISSWVYLIDRASQLSVLDSAQVMPEYAEENVRIKSLVPLDCSDLKFAATGIFKLNTKRQTFVDVHTNCEDIIQTDAYEFCEEEGITISAPDSILATGYYWSTGDTTQSITLDTGGDYSLILYTECGQLYDTIHLTSLPSPTAAFDESLNGSILTLTNNSSNADSYLWNFGDGTISTEENPLPHEYVENGVYTVMLIVTNDCGSDVATAEITIAEPPKADFSAEMTSGCVPFVVQFSDESSNSPTAWYWEFEGGEPATSTEQNPDVTYLNAGVYSVTLTVTNTFGSNMFVQAAYITAMDIPDAGFTYEQNGLQVNFQSNDPMATHSWDFGDGQFGSMANPVHNYAQAGSYTVIHTVENDCGESSQTETIMLVTAVNTPSVSAAWSIYPNPFGEQITIETQGLDIKSDVWSVKLIDLQGRMVSSREMQQKRTVLDTEALPSGTYLLQFFKNGALVSSRKLVKVR